MTLEKSAVAAVIYFGNRSPSVQVFRGLEPINGVPLALNTLHRLQSGMSDQVGRWIVAAHSQRVAEALAGAPGPSFEVLVLPQVGMIATLAEAARQNPEIKTWLLFAENAVFPDCEIVGRMLRFHVEKDSLCTFAPHLPAGLTPAIIDRDAMASMLQVDSRPAQSMAELNPFVALSNFLVWGGAAQIRSADESRSAQVFTETPEAWAKGAGLPASMLITDFHTRTAAERAEQATHGNSHSSVDEAVFFRKYCLESLTAPPRFAEQAPARLPGSVPVLFSALTIDFAGADQSLLLLLENLDRSRVHPVLVVRADCLLARRAKAAGVTVEIADTDFQDPSPYNMAYCDALLRRHEIRLVHIDFSLNLALMITAHMREVPVTGHIRIAMPPVLPESVLFARKFVCISDFVAQSMRRANVPGDSIVRVYNGVDLSSFRPREHDRAALREKLGIPQDAFVVSMVARLIPDKRQDLLVRAMARLAREVPDCRAVFFGEAMQTSDELWLRKIVSDLGVEKHVVFAGYEPQVARAYAISDATVVCRNIEGFGRCVLESMAMQVPVVVPRAGGCVELAEHERHGLHFAPDSDEDLALQLRRLVAEPGLKERLGRQALDRARDFDIRHHARQMEEIFLSLLPAEVHAA